VLSVLEENNATPITAGVSLSVDRASVVGLNEATIIATGGNGYEAGKSYSIYISTGTVDGVSVVGEVVEQFTIGQAAAAVQIGAAGAGLTDLGGMSTGMKSEVESEANDALVAQKLDHLVAVAESDDPADDSIIAKMVDRSSTADWSSFIHTEDSLRALSEEISAIGSASGGGFNFAPVGDNALEDQIDNLGVAVDKGTSPETVGIPVAGHAFKAGHEVTITGTANYSGSNPYVIDSVTTNEVVIVAAFVSETFSSSDNIDSSIKGTTIEGVETTNTFAAVSGQDGVYHVIDDDGGDNFTIAYRFEIGGDRIATEAVLTGFLNSGNDNALVQAYDFVGSAWETRRQFDGQNGSVNQTVVVPLLARNTGTSGVDFGVVFLRVTDGAASSNPTFNNDSFLVEAVGIGQSAGYQNGQIWLDTVGGTDSADKFVDGTSDRPVKTMANVVSLVAAGLSPDVHVLNGSSVTLGANSDNYSFFGDNWTLALASRSVVGAYLQGARVTGIGTSSSEVKFEGCDVGTASVQIGHFDFCSFDGTVTMTLAGDYNYHNCYSKVAGAGSPTFTKTADEAITAQWRNWQGGITFSGLQVGDTLTIGGRLGTVDLGSPASAVAVEIRGTYKEITNVGSAVVNTDGAIKGVDVADILVDTAEIGTAGAGLTNINLPNQTMNIVGDITGNLSGSVGSVSGAVGSVSAAVTVGTINTDAIDAVAVDTDVYDELLDFAAGVDTSLTLRQHFRLAAAALYGKASGLATTTAIYRNIPDDVNAITATVDGDGNRSAVTLDKT
jgi:hypothetical protein